MSEVYTGVDGHSINTAFTIPTDGDDLAATSVDDAFQQGADNWAHAVAAYPDTYNGGNYTANHGAVGLGGTWSWSPTTGNQAITAAGSASSSALVGIIQSGAGAGLAVVQLGSGKCVVVSSTTGNAIDATSTGGGYAVKATGDGAGQPAARVDSGPVVITGMGGVSSVGDPVTNSLYGANICKAWGTILVPTSSSAVTLVDGFNVASVAVGNGRGAVANKGIVVTFATPLADQGSGTNGFSTSLVVQPPASGSIPMPFVVTASSTELVFGAQSPGASPADIDFASVTTTVYMFQVFGTQ